MGTFPGPGDAPFVHGRDGEDPGKGKREVMIIRKRMCSTIWEEEEIRS